MTERLDYQGAARHGARRGGAAFLGAPPARPGRAGHRRVLPVLVPQSRPRATRRRDHRRGSAGRAHLAVVERPAGHPRIPAAVDDGHRRLCRPQDRELSGPPRRPAVAGRRRHAATLPDAVERRTDAHFDRCAASQSDIVVGPGRRRHRRDRIGTARRRAARRHLRHGRHQHRHQRHRRRPGPRDDGRQYRRPGYRHADAEGAHARRRRRHHRLGRQGRSAQSRSAQLRARIPVRPATAAAAKRRPSPTPMSSLAR